MNIQMKVLRLLAILVAAFLVTSSSYALDKTDTEHSSSKNALNTINSPFFDSVMVADSMTISKNRKIFIEAPKVSFSESWMREYEQKTQSRYRERVKKDYSGALLKQLKRHLKSDGWKILDEQQSDALRLQVHLRDLDIEAPDISNIKNALVVRIGVSEIDFMLYDLDNQLILEASDRGAAGSVSGGLIEADNATNFSWFNRLMSIWAEQFTFYATSLADTQLSK
jgi:hypothetical protein